MSNLHYSVLLNESIDGLNIKEGGIYVDATLGYAGHSLRIAKAMKRGTLFAFDEDQDAVDYGMEVFKDYDNVNIIHSNFVNLKEELQKFNVEKIDGIVFDLGLSSPEIDNKERGFSFMKDAPLDMRMDRRNEKSAKTVVNEYDYGALIDIFFRYGEERYSKQIAKNILYNRPINTTMELVDIIKKSVPVKYFNTHHPERQIFQAIRIEVNEELKVLEKVLPDAIEMLNPGGRIAVISFHSLEDRIVKHIFRKYSEVDELVKGLPEIMDEFKPKLKLINKKPILPSEEELKENSRSKSAKLRIAERLWKHENKTKKKI